MKSRLFALPLAFVLAASIGCSDDDDKPTAPENEEFTEGTVETGGVFVSSVDASDRDLFTGLSFEDGSIVHDVSTAQGTAWDVAFRREVVKLNGGASGPGVVEGADLGAVDFAAVGAEEAAGASFESDAVDYFIDNWYDYNPQTHELTMNRRVYSMLDATGDHWVKFRIDELEGAAMGSMGTVHLSYFFQVAPGSPNLDGEIETATVEVGFGTGYFDFSSGQQVTPADPGSSMAWDLQLGNFNLALNSGPSGPGECAAFFAYSELADETAIEAFTTQPMGAPLFTDIPGSALTDWYDYDGTTHSLSSKRHVYLIRKGDDLYKVRIDGYYGERGGAPASGLYTVTWDVIE